MKRATDIARVEKVLNRIGVMSKTETSELDRNGKSVVRSEIVVGDINGGFSFIFNDGLFSHWEVYNEV